MPCRSFVSFVLVCLSCAEAPDPARLGAVRAELAPAPRLEPVLRAEWGSEDEQLGRVRPSEASPECPHSFVVDGAGAVHVLDQVNRRIASFDGAWRYTPLRGSTADDLVLDGAGDLWVFD